VRTRTICALIELQYECRIQNDEHHTWMFDVCSILKQQSLHSFPSWLNIAINVQRQLSLCIINVIFLNLYSRTTNRKWCSIHYKKKSDTRIISKAYRADALLFLLVTNLCTTLTLARVIRGAWSKVKQHVTSSPKLGSLLVVVVVYIYTSLSTPMPPACRCGAITCF
jgi:hypothetical protein